jgi:hypothetical protein
MFIFFQIGLSEYAALRPTRCVPAGSSESHNVCVCIHPQNPKLMLAGAHIQEKFDELMSKLVFSLTNEMCMMYGVYGVRTAHLLNLLLGFG